ncbi:MAG: aminotransferase class I/II-fold pyridoxal phosphate-dependent enzyme [Armatimonadetes bacterium]|nr:aminotransferase class I/II-fold pyridoxal phosphate-dependent enzyme [Armatimonadota bacterium]
MIDFKSDIINEPTDAMWDAMRAAKPDWIIDRQDPSVNRLEEMAARLMGKEAALLVLTGRMANLVALMTFAERGHQVIVEKNSHIAWSEEWGISYIGGLYPRLVEGRAGVMDPADVEAAITDNRFNHIPVTDLVCLENTHNMAGGTVTSLEQTKALCDVAHRHGASVFIDGARILHAAFAFNVTPAELVAPADAVVFSLIKGLCAPAGAMLCGSTKDIERAYVNLKRLGAWSFHKAGILAAAGIVALETMVDRLRDDQRRAKQFANELNEMPGISVDLASVQTNIVMADISQTGLTTDEFLARLLERGVRGHRLTEQIARFTFHRHITDDGVEIALKVIREVVGST